MEYKKLCICISTPNEYNDVFYAFRKCLHYNWDDCKLPKFVVTDHDVNLEEDYKVFVFKKKNNNWCTRMLFL